MTSSTPRRGIGCFPTGPDLVFVFSSLHLVDKVEAAEYCDTVIEWQESSCSSGSSSSEEDE
jgi:hypothetical protein